jgi:hypothetical protein
MRSSEGNDQTLTLQCNLSLAKKISSSFNSRKKSLCPGKILQPASKPTWVKPTRYPHYKCASSASENGCVYGPKQTLEPYEWRTSTGHRTSSTSFLKRLVEAATWHLHQTANIDQMLEYGAQEKWTSRQCARKWSEIDPAPTPYAHYEHLQHSFAPYTMSPVEAPQPFLPYMNVQ